MKTKQNPGKATVQDRSAVDEKFRYLAAITVYCWIFPEGFRH